MSRITTISSETGVWQPAIQIARVRPTIEACIARPSPFPKAGPVRTRGRSPESARRDDVFPQLFDSASRGLHAVEAGRASHRSELTPKCPRDLLELPEKLLEPGEIQRLRAVREGLVGIGMDLDHEPVSACGQRGQCHRRHVLAAAGAVAG